MSGRGKKLSMPRKQNFKKLFISEKKKKNQDRTITDIRILFEIEEEKEERKKQEHN